ncbi:ABC transporter permease [Nonomuraea pusilla]|uniref:ABC-type nitrate/sulfonate/bicarbonate transport system, permease component n=1 Tax=Nonomuraea pusilla TaxID=46177 RepID=A0A1H8JXQ5_9ACTN|nr:ABC transporter permease subunit [Nonomuraea pusilla]SEN85046.1 ABC-type nitrate/sulfonate/bicarbonate transport system, permease component [Nonomuraea pusilla]
MIRKFFAGLLRLWLVPVVLAVWEVATRAMEHPFFPPPSQIVVRMRDLWFSGSPSTLWMNDTALGNIPNSLGRLLAGWAVSGVVGVVVGIWLGRSPMFFRFVDPLIQFGRALPPPALLPLFMALFSIGTRMQVATITFGIIWPVLFNAAEGARGVDPLHLETARVFRFSRARRFFTVILPSATPKIFAGLRLSLSLALILMVISELFSTDGIGSMLRDAQRSFDLRGVWGAVILLGTLGYLLNQVFLVVERKALTWHYSAKKLV